MHAREYSCTVTETTRVGEGILRLGFEPTKKFAFDPGQFISVVVPPRGDHTKPVKRLYSLAVSPNIAREKGYELCVRLHPNGVGSHYLAEMKVGDTFQVWAPYGDFLYRAPQSGRKVCFICTGTGVGPIRSFVTSETFLKNPPPHSLALVGFHSDSEIMYSEDFDASGIKLIVAISKPSRKWSGFKGRVTDYLRQNTLAWDWTHTDYYLCGNPKMIAETRFLLASFGVSAEAVHQEAFTSNVPTLHPAAA